MQSFAEVLADEMARLDHAEMPPASAFAPPMGAFESGLMAALGAAFFSELPEAPRREPAAPPPAEVLLVAAPLPAPPQPAPREGGVARLLRRFRDGHVEPAIVG